MQKSQAVMEDAMPNASDLAARCLQCGTKTGTWLMLPPFTDNGTELGDQEWCAALFLHYRIYPPDLPPKFYGYGATFSISHDLDCKKG